MVALGTIEAMCFGRKKPVMFLLGSVVLASSLLPHLVAVGEEAESAPLLWRTEIIDSDGDTGWYTSLALDPKTGYSRLSYYNHTRGELMYASWDGEQWQIETVDSKGRVGWYSSLALASDTGEPRIAYHDVDQGDLKYAEWSDGRWKIQVVDEAGLTGRYTSLKLDPKTQYPRISYYDYGGSLRYAAWDGQRWNLEAVDSDGRVGSYSDLVLDPNTGYPRIAYLSTPDFHLRVALWTGEEWEIHVPDPCPGVGMYPTIVLDSKRNPHVVYYDRNNAALKYTFYDGESWQVRFVDKHRPGRFPHIQLDPETEFPFVCYHDDKDGAEGFKLKCAVWDGESWDIYIVDSGGIQSSMVLDPGAHLPMISHYDYLTKTLRFARAYRASEEAEQEEKPK